MNNEEVEELEKLLDGSSLGKAETGTVTALADAAVERARSLEGARFVVGIELMPFRLTATVVDQNGMRLLDAHRRLESMNSSDVVEAASELAAELISQAGLSDLPTWRIVVGLQLGGPVNSCTGEVLFYHKSSPHDQFDKMGFTTWRNQQLGTMLAEATGHRVVIENDGNALAAYQLWFGIGRQHPTFALMLVREGVGGAYVQDGHLSRAPAEIGQINAQVFGLPCDCGRQGCVEAVAGIRGILMGIHQYSGQKVNGLNEAVALTHSSDGDVAAKATMTFREAGTGLAHGVGLMINMFGGESPLVICLPPILTNSETAASHEYQLQMRRYQRHTHPAFEDCEVIVHPLGPYDGAHGAALIALNRLFGMRPQSTLCGDHYTHDGDSRETVSG